MDREQVLTIIDAAYAARMRGDPAEVGQIWAAGATFELAGEKSLLAAFPAAGPGAAQPTVEAIMALVKFTAVERLDAVVEGRRAAVLSRVTMRFGGLEPFATLVYDLWELDEDGTVRALLQFSDTAKVASEMARLAANTTSH
jgi:ketosteroid isomerase-like protein